MLGSLVDVDVEGGDAHMGLDGRVSTFEFNGLLLARDWIKRPAQNVALRIAVDVASALVELDKLWFALKVVEQEDASRFRDSESGGDLRELGLLELAFFLQFFVELYGLRRSGCPILFEFVGRWPVNERVGQFLPFLAFRAVVVDAVSFDFVFGYQLVGAILENEAVGRVLGGYPNGCEQHENEKRESTNRRHSSFIIPLLTVIVDNRTV